MDNNDSITFLEVARRLWRKLCEPGALATMREVLRADREAVLSLGLLLEQNAAQRPDRVALKFETRSWTWGQLNAWANRYAHALAAQGVAKGDVVAINLHNSPELIVTVCAAAKCGAVSAMINTAHHGQVLQHSLDLVKPKIIVSGETHLEALAAECSTGNPASTQQVRLKDPCFYIYTSGTTGLPKASVQTHYRWYRSALGTARLTLNLTENDVFYCCLPLYHSNPLTFALGSSLVSGAALAIGRKFSASGFWDEVRAHQATAFVYIGELLRYLLNQPAQANDRQHCVHMVFGNGLRPELWDAFKTRFGIPRIHEFYGSSEGNNGFVNLFNFDKTCGWSSFGWEIVGYDLNADAPVRKRNGRLKKLKRGDTGLLLFEVNDTLPFDGYTDPIATEKKLLRDVFKKGDCWFNTGDLMKHQGSGHAQFVDRLGDTFRWQGENVATTEVEAVINAWPQTADAVVYGVEVPNRDGRCGMACLTLKPGVALDAAGFAAHLRQRLPKYAVPRFLRLQDAQSTTSTFKHQKSELKKQGYSATPEPVFVLATDSSAWQPLDALLNQRIRNTELML